MDLIGDSGSFIIQGRLTDPSGAPRRGLYVNLRPAFSTEYIAFSSRSNEEGRYRLEDLAPGDYTMTINPPGGGPTPPISPIKESIRIQSNLTRDFTF